MKNSRFPLLTQHGAPEGLGRAMGAPAGSRQVLCSSAAAPLSPLPKPCPALTGAYWEASCREPGGWMCLCPSIRPGGRSPPRAPHRFPSPSGSAPRSRSAALCTALLWKLGGIDDDVSSVSFCFLSFFTRPARKTKPQPKVFRPAGGGEERRAPRGTEQRHAAARGGRRNISAHGLHAPTLPALTPLP